MPLIPRAGRHGFERTGRTKDWAADRLPLVQIVVAQGARGSDPGRNYRWLLENAGRVYEELQWSWEAFLEGKLDVYVGQVREVEDYDCMERSQRRFRWWFWIVLLTYVAVVLLAALAVCRVPAFIAGAGTTPTPVP